MCEITTTDIIWLRYLCSFGVECDCLELFGVLSGHKYVNMFTTLGTNFTGALDTGVDPRTGQFFVNLPLTEINGNHLSGPVLNLSARYSSLSEVNHNGLGKGFTLGGVSFFNAVSRRLTLSNGESWPVDTSNVIPDRRLKDCIFSMNSIDDTEEYKLNWKSGVTEYLSPIGGSIYATSRIISPIGKKIKLNWAWNGTSVLLNAITDLQSELCRFQYNDAGVVMTLWPNAVEESRFIFNLQNEQLSSLRRPVSAFIESEFIEWNFKYELVGPFAQKLLTSVACPTGMTHIVSYTQQNGLDFPSGSDLQWLPVVKLYTLNYGSNQPPKTSRFTYTSNNFLGHNADTNVFGTWSKQSDYIYGILTNKYTYGSTETISTDKDSVEITRTYNNYHFLISTKTSRSACEVLKEMEYYAIVGDPSNSQPAQYMLPSKQLVTFQDNNGNKRVEETITKFDEYGNPTYSETPDGTVTKYEYYPARGNADCPADPNGFIRFLKQKTIEPRNTTYVDTPKHITRYKYSRLGNTEHVVQKIVSEYTCTDNSLKLMTQRTTIYANDVNTIKFGRITAIIDVKYENGENSQRFITRHDFVTTISDGVILQEMTFTGQDCAHTTVSRRLSACNGVLYSQISPQGVEKRYAYDSLGRMVSRTLCPGSEYENITTWAYLIQPEGSCSIETDSSGNKIKTAVDGAGRIVHRHVFESDTSKWYETFSCNHSHIGEVTDGVVTDWVPGGADYFSLLSEISYGGWGEKKTVTYSDGRVLQQEIDLINLKQTVYSNGGFGSTLLRNGSVTTTLDRISQLPVRKELNYVSGEEESACQYIWDGFGQLRQEQDEMGAVTKREYDEYGRLLKQTLPDGTIVARTYAPHLTGSQIASISVTGLDSTGNPRTWILGNQTFDSLGRLTKSTSGGRSTSYTYLNSSPAPSSIRMPSDKTKTYTYIPELGNAVSTVTSDEFHQTFTYASKTGKLLTATETDSITENTWTSHGLLQEQKFSRNQQTRRAKYTHTMNGIPVTYTDITDKQILYNMNKHGQVTSIIDDALTVNMAYDALGRLISQTVRDANSNSSFTTTINFDVFGREITRTITNDQRVELLISQTWLKNGLLSTRTTQKNTIKLREEQYNYDSRKRLIGYKVSGLSLPVDAYGRLMTDQTYRYDALNNLTCVKTILSGGTENVTTFIYGNENDPTQLTAITHTLAGYPESISLAYDSEGRLIRDEAGRTLTYDATGRLVRVNDNKDIDVTYGYNALNQLIIQSSDNNDTRELFYRGNELVNEITTKENRETRLVKTGHTCLGVSDGGNLILTAGDRHDSLLWPEDGRVATTEVHVWSPYGSGTTNKHLPGFNGEIIDPVSGVYHLGNGYRAYNPVLMRFNCPDSLSPFGAGGINPYAYCSGDPINQVDPSGHLSWEAIFGIVWGAIGLVGAVFTGGASIAAAGGVMAAISAASAAELTLGALASASTIIGITSDALEEVAPQASSMLGWMSLGTGVPGMVAQLPHVISYGFSIAERVKTIIKEDIDVYFDISFLSEIKWNRMSKLYRDNVSENEVVWDQLRNVRIKKFKSGARNRPNRLSGMDYDWGSNRSHRNKFNGKLFNGKGKNFKKHISKNFATSGWFDVHNSSKYTTKLNEEMFDVNASFCFSRNDSTLAVNLNLPRATPYPGYSYNELYY